MRYSCSVLTKVINQLSQIALESRLWLCTGYSAGPSPPIIKQSSNLWKGCFIYFLGCCSFSLFCDFLKEEMMKSNLRNKQPKLCKERGSNRGRKRQGRMVKFSRHIALVSCGSKKHLRDPKMSNINLFSYWNRTHSLTRATTIIVGKTNAIVRRSFCAFPLGSIHSSTHWCQCTCNYLVLANHKVQFASPCWLLGMALCNSTHMENYCIQVYLSLILSDDNMES
jgi:hypothetical protein